MNFPDSDRVISSAEAYLPAHQSPSSTGTGAGSPPTLPHETVRAISPYSDHDEDVRNAQHSDERQHSDYEIREEVLDARLRARASSMKSSLQWAVIGGDKSERTSVGRSSTSGMPFRPDERGPTAPRMPRSQTHRSLLGSSAFGFDAQNGDPRIMAGGEKAATYIDSSSKPFASSASHRPSLSGDGFHDIVSEDVASRIELITVPALGAEYTDQELRDLRRERKEKKLKLGRRQRCVRCMGSDRHVCGCFTAKMLVFFAFFSLIALAIVLYFVIARIPRFAVQTTTPLFAVPNGASMVTHHAPTNFSMDMNVNLRADNTDGWVPSRASQMTLDVTDLSTMRKVGQGTMRDYTFAARKKTLFLFPVHFAYASVNVTGDQTWSHWINACGPRYDNTPRQSLNLQFTLRMHISGRIGTAGTSVQLSDLECPFTLQAEQT